jgi:polar amino acid transport system substrate-binding protein
LTAARVKLGASAAALCMAVLPTGCGTTRSATGGRFEPATPGVLTVATAFLPAPGFWQGPLPWRGVEGGLATALAKHLGLDRVKVVQSPFASIVRGQMRGADLALSQLTPTAEREHSVDFSTPYLSAPPGVLARLGADAVDEKELRQLDWVVSSASTLTPIVMKRIRPLHAPIVVQDRAQALDVLRAGHAEALLLDLPVALALARAEPQLFHVPAQLDGEETLAAALPNGSPNLEVVDSAIRSLQADGTIERLTTRWLGTTGHDVPLILTQQ